MYYCVLLLRSSYQLWVLPNEFNPPPVRFITSLLSHKLTPTAVCVQQNHKLTWQTWPSCLVIWSQHLHSAYQSAPPADYLTGRAKAKASSAEGSPDWIGHFRRGRVGSVLHQGGKKKKKTNFKLAKAELAVQCAMHDSPSCQSVTPVQNLLEIF